MSNEKTITMKVCDSKGVFVKDKIAVLAVLLPQPAANNKYEIEKPFRLPNANTVVLQFKDQLGKKLETTEDNFETFILDFSGLGEFDQNSDIIVALFHENQMNRAQINARLEEIVQAANMGTCEMISFGGLIYRSLLQKKGE